MGAYGSIIKGIGEGSLGFVKGTASAAAAIGTTTYSMATMASKIPWWVSVPVAAGIGLAWDNASTNPIAKIARSPAPSMQPNPYGYNSTSNVKDMGASGDLVLALNNLSH